MNIYDALQKRNNLWGTRISVSGTLRAIYSFGQEPYEDMPYIASDPKKDTNFDETVLINRPGLAETVLREVGHWYGGYLFNHPTQVWGMLNKSANPMFPAELNNVTRIDVEVLGEISSIRFTNNI